MAARGASLPFFLSTCSLILFVLFVPHRYIYSDAGGVEGQVANLIPLIPVVMSASLTLWSLLTHPWALDRFSAILFPAAAFVLLTLLSGLGASLPFYSLSRDVYYLLTGIPLAFVAHRAFAGRQKQVAALLVLSAGLLGLLCVHEFASGSRLFWSETFTNENIRYFSFASDDFGRRVLGTVGHPVYLGTYFALMMPLALWTTFAWKGFRRFLGFLGLVAIGLGLILTFSRGAWFAGLLACLVYLKRRSSREIWIATMVLVVVLVSALSVDKVWKTLESRETVGQLRAFKTDQRGIAYSQATSILMGRPLLGVGTGFYRYAARDAGDFNETPDNMYLRFLAEHGIAGYCAFVATIVSLMRHLRSGTGRGFSPESDLCLAVFAGLVGYLVDMMTCDALHFSLTRIGFWLVAGLGLATCRRVTADEFVAAGT